MTAYSNIINKAVNDAMSDDGFNAKTAAPNVYQKISRDDRKRTSIATITKDLREAARDLAKAAMKAKEHNQLGFSFLLLPGAVSVDDEGAKVKLTLSLSRMEFRRETESRRKRQTSLGEVAEEMEAAEAVAAPYWDAHPDWTFGECIDALEIDANKTAAVTA